MKNSRLDTIVRCAVGGICCAFIACGANTRYTKGFNRKEFDAILIGHTTSDVYDKLGNPTYAWFSKDHTFANVEYIAQPEHKVVEAKLKPLGHYAELRYSEPKRGTDHYYLFYVLLKDNVVIEKGGPVYQD